MEFLAQTWPWYVSGPLIGLIMLALVWMGKTFGMSSNLRTLCTMSGAGKFVPFFQFDWRAQRWNLAVVFGAMLGGFVAANFLSSPANVAINPQTVANLQKLGIDAPFGRLMPEGIFGHAGLSQPKMIFTLLMGGVLIGFGTRYAGGCTSGHAISGLSNLQIPSLKATIGFFIGGLLMSWFILPLIF
jgi:uncharacterized membrane protein YedE/YeeE